ncbi:MAG: universal stress protein [Fimbriimonas sp.]|nr:universal stress protein [Fimbriimonas sp.]
MKIVVGVDTAGHYRACLNMASRLGFPEPHYMLAHSVEVKIPMSVYGSAAEAAYRAEFVQMSNVTGENALEGARQYACERGMEAETILLAGEAAAALCQYAEGTQTELIAVHSDRKGRLGSFFLGSVSRGLAIGAHQCILITKGDVDQEGEVSAVFATDHSSYANRALDRLIDMKPHGLRKIKVVSILHMGGRTAVEAGEPPHAAETIEESLWHEVCSKTDSVVEKLQASGYECTGEVANAHVHEGISDAMRAENADLLIIGAQGHGFVHRMMLGSTSLHQVVSEPYSVLIVRT